MMKKYISLLLLMILTITTVGSVSAAVGTPVAVAMTVGTPTYSLVAADHTKTPIAAPQNGTVETSLTVSNYGDGEPTATLIVAVITKATGALYDVGCDVQTISDGQATLAAAAELPNTAAYTYRYMVWDNFENMIALGNSAPLAPEGLASTDVSTSTVSLTWTPAEDDVAVDSYKVFRDDVEIGTTQTPTYTDTGLDENTTFSYKVVAVDGLGEASAASQALSVTTNRTVRMPMDGYTKTGNVGASSYPFSQSISGGLLSSAGFDTVLDGETVGDAGSLYVEGGLANAAELTANSYSFENYVNADGSKIPCVTTYKMTKNYGLRFRVDEGFIAPTDNNVSFIVKYLDNFDSSKYIQISYVGENGKKVSDWSNAIQGSNTGKWKEAVFSVSDAALSGNPAFCIRPYNIDNIVYISEVGVAKNYVAQYPMLMAPTELVATNITNSTVDLSWTASDAQSIAYYNIYCDGEVIAQTTDTTYKVEGLSDGTTYVYTVTTVDERGEESENFVSVSVTTEAIIRMDMSGVTDNGTSTYRPTKTAADGMLSMKGVDTRNISIVSDGLPTVANSVSFTDYTDPVTGDTIPCFTSYNLTANFGLQFNFGSEFLNTEDTNTVTFFVKYLDNFESDQYIQIGYVKPGSSNSPTMQTTAIAGGNTGEWKEAQVTYTDVRSDKNPDFCIRPYGIEGVVYISEVGIAKNYVPRAE